MRNDMVQHHNEHFMIVWMSAFPQSVAVVFMFFVWRCVFMFKFFCVCFWMDTVANNGWKYDLLILCMLPPFSCYCDIEGELLVDRPLFGFGTVLFEMQIISRWSHSLIFSHEEGKDDGKKKEREKNFEFVVTTFCLCWRQMDQLKMYFVQKGRCRLVMISMFWLLCCVSMWWLSLSLFILPLTPSVSGFCPFLWTTLCVFTRCWCRDWK